MSPLKADTFSRIFCCSPALVAIVISIIIIPKAIAVIAIFIIGAEILLLYSLEATMRRAMKNSKFTSYFMPLSVFKNTFFLVKLWSNKLKGFAYFMKPVILTSINNRVMTKPSVFLVKAGSLCLLLISFSCGSGTNGKNEASANDLVIHDTMEVGGLEAESKETGDIIVGAALFSEYVPLIEN